MPRSITSNCIILILIFLECCSSFNFTNQNGFEDLEVGVPFTLTWEDAEGAVTLGLLLKNTSSSPEASYIIASKYEWNMENGLLIVCAAGITESQFDWTPPDWTSGLFEQKIEAQDDKNLTLTGNLTVSKAVSNQNYVHSWIQTAECASDRERSFGCSLVFNIS